jgi:lipopolysaccharide transport system permease protein
MAEARDGAPVVIIEPSSGWVWLKLHELWVYRELLYFLAWREVKVRYKQTVIGAAWAVIQPLFAMLAFSLFFGKLAKMPSDGIPYPVFSLSGLVPWTFFSNGLTQSANSLVGNANLISKVYFPRLTVPIAAVLSGVIDFVIALAMLFIVILSYGIVPAVNALWIPAFMLLALVTALGVGLWLAALNVEYRDIRYVVPFLIQFWMFATPLVYPSSLIKDPTLRMLYALNPLVGVVEGFRWALFGAGSAPGPMFAASAAAGLVLLISGALYFRRMEKTFADVV